eukprot:355515-Chlamydomonas_euryale.AAC.3
MQSQCAAACRGPISVETHGLHPQYGLSRNAHVEQSTNIMTLVMFQQPMQHMASNPHCCLSETSRCRCRRSRLTMKKVRALQNISNMTAVSVSIQMASAAMSGLQSDASGLPGGQPAPDSVFNPKTCSGIKVWVTPCTCTA